MAPAHAGSGDVVNNGDLSFNHSNTITLATTYRAQEESRTTDLALLILREQIPIAGKTISAGVAFR